jgi:hypothetical protein
MENAFDTASILSEMGETSLCDETCGYCHPDPTPRPCLICGTTDCLVVPPHTAEEMEDA